MRSGICPILRQPPSELPQISYLAPWPQHCQPLGSAHRPQRERWPAEALSTGTMSSAMGIMRSYKGEGTGAYCPSSTSSHPGASVLGIVTGTASQPTVTYLAEPIPITDEIRSHLKGVPETQVLRVAAPCSETRCRHFDGSDCTLISKLARLDPSPDGQHDSSAFSIPNCYLRPRCRWWQQEKLNACRQCPLVVTDNVQPSEVILRATDPTVSPAEFTRGKMDN
jgi:hypothetical protein